MFQKHNVFSRTLHLYSPCLKCTVKALVSLSVFAFDQLGGYKCVTRLCYIVTKEKGRNFNKAFQLRKMLTVYIHKNLYNTLKEWGKNREA